MKIPKILLSVTICIVGLVCMSSNPPESKSSRQRVSSSTVILLRKPVSVSVRPKMPSFQRVECCYDGSNLHLMFAYSDGLCDLTVTDVQTLETCSYSVDTSDCTAEVYVGELYESTVTLTTEAGVVYTAVLTAE